ncbi:MAG: tyrosine-type recombinase/integrase [Thermodesulfobacteriota bacterium]|uniref:tyrosine-type recombinase/integrase n=1 Tax=Desulfosalsimonas sp. TaxID=3073848 RepID=UPI003971108B
MAKKKLNHHLYQDSGSQVWYFQKKVKGFDKPYKFSMETTSVTEARRKRDEYLKENLEYHGFLPRTKAQKSDEGRLFGEVAQQWADITKGKLAETTYESYRKVMNTHILPNFGNMPIKSISSLDIEIFISKLSCNNKTKLMILTPLRLVIKFAKKHNFIAVNPFDDVEPIKNPKRTKKRALTLDEINQFINSLNDWWVPLFVFLFFSGARIAEASGLKWKHVNLKKGSVKIEKNLVRGKGGKMIYKVPKTDTSIREIKLPSFVIEALQDQRKRSWKGSGEDFVFINKAGKPIHRQTLNESVINPTLKKIGLSRKISIKDTRATYITNTLDANERLSFVQGQCGFTTPQMIINHYYRNIPAKYDGALMEKAWNSTRILPESEGV